MRVSPSTPLEFGFNEQIEKLKSKSDREIEDEAISIENSLKNIRKTPKNQKILTHLKRAKFMYQLETQRRKSGAIKQ